MSVDESETEVSGALGQAAHGTGAILSVVGGGPGVLIDEPILESAVDENGELSSGGGDGFGFTDAIGETSIVGAKEVEVAVEKSVLKPIRIPARMATRP